MARKNKPERDTSDMPYVANYPPLQAWLHKIDARCNWQLVLGDGTRGAIPAAYVESYIAPGCRPFIVVIYSRRGGWSIFTDGASAKIDDSLEDAERRIRLRVRDDGGPSTREKDFATAEASGNYAGTDGHLRCAAFADGCAHRTTQVVADLRGRAKTIREFGKYGAHNAQLAGAFEIAADAYERGEFVS